jgi:hypothetical protein
MNIDVPISGLPVENTGVIIGEKKFPKFAWTNNRNTRIGEHTEPFIFKIMVKCVK